MLPISEMVSVARLLDDEGRWSVADEAAAAWGAEAAVFVRSSACHVFRSNRDGASSPLMLRMRPYTKPGLAALRRSALAAHALHAAGASVAAATRSLGGSWVELHDGYPTMAVQALAGVRYSDDEVDEEIAQAWGAALARIHLAGFHAGVTHVPDIVSRCLAAQESLPTDNAGGSIPAGDIITELRRLTLGPQVYGLLHGDPEIDNVIFTEDGPVMVDLDDVRHGWFAADIGFALRDWAEIAEAPDVSAPIPQAFITGYRTIRQISEEELSWMPLLARAAGLETLAELKPLLTEAADPDWPDWAHGLAARVRERVDALQRALTAGDHPARELRGTG